MDDLLKTPNSDNFRFSEQENRILQLWDQELELQLELNLLKAQYEAQHEDLSFPTDEELQSQVAQGERDLLTARSKYNIRQNIIQQVLITDPILKSVHSSAHATQLESRLLPLINERDTLAMLHSSLSSRLQTLHQRIAKLEQENIDMIESNKALAQRMLALAEEAKVERVEEVRDARVRGQLEKLEEDVKRARREWRVMKSVAGGIVAGSGVDWANNPVLLDVVMDDEDELG
jgi:hypothetical protein